MQEFDLKTKVYFGENALDHLLDKDSKCAFIVADPFTVKSEKMLFDVITGAFAQRRKTMLNSLSSSISFVSKERLSEIIAELGFDTNIRGEKLSISDFCALADKIYEEKQK